MIPASSLAFAGVTHAKVRRHLFPGDGCEAAAILLCSKPNEGMRPRLLVRDAILVPHADCVRREPDWITWPGAWIEVAIDAADKDDLALVLIHSHPGGLFAFSDADDASDRNVIPSLFQALGPQHGSAVMTPEGAVLVKRRAILPPDRRPILTPRWGETVRRRRGGAGLGCAAAPAPGRRRRVFQSLFLKRQLSLPVSTISQ